MASNTEDIFAVSLMGMILWESPKYSVSIRSQPPCCFSLDRGSDSHTVENGRNKYCQGKNVDGLKNSQVREGLGMK